MIGMHLASKISGTCAVLLCLTACGGGGSSGGTAAAPAPAPPPPDAEIGGFYTVQLTTAGGLSGEATLAVTEDGEFVMSEDPSGALDGLYFRGQLDVDQQSLTGAGVQLAVPGFADFLLDSGVATRRIEFTLDGTVTTERQSLSGTAVAQGIADTTSFSAASSDDLRDFYNSGSSLEDVAGRYVDIITGTNIQFEIDGEGNISGLNANCDLSGRVVPVDSRFNLYDLRVVVANCPIFIEGEYNGLASRDEAAGVPLLIASGDDGGETPFVFIFDRF